MIGGRGERLAGAGRPVHRQVGRVEVEQRGGDRRRRRPCRGAAARRCGCGAAGAAGCRSPRSAAGRAGPRRRRRRSPRWSRAAGLSQSADPASARTAAGRKGPPPWVLVRRRCTSVGASGSSQSMTVDGPERPALGVVGEARGRRRLVERVHRRCPSSPAAMRPWSLHPAAAACAPSAGCASRCRSRRIVGDEHVCVVGPFVDGIVEPVEMAPPERLVLAAVIAARRRDHRHRSLFRAAGDGVVADELRQCARQLVVVGRRARRP